MANMAFWLLTVTEQQEVCDCAIAAELTNNKAKIIFFIFCFCLYS
jgi:hypothetical protein